MDRVFIIVNDMDEHARAVRHLEGMDYKLPVGNGSQLGEHWLSSNGGPIYLIGTKSGRISWISDRMFLKEHKHIPFVQTRRGVPPDHVEVGSSEVYVVEEGKPPRPELKVSMMGDAVKKPSHYQLGQTGVEAIDIIEAALNSEACAHFTPHQAYCFGNFLKYRLRAGEKDNLEQDIGKSNFYLNDLFGKAEL